MSEPFPVTEKDGVDFVNSTNNFFLSDSTDYNHLLHIFDLPLQIFMY